VTEETAAAGGDNHCGGSKSGASALLVGERRILGFRRESCDLWCVLRVVLDTCPGDEVEKSLAKIRFDI